MAGVLAAILAIAGCAFNGTSEANAASVRESLAVMPQGWMLSYVDGDSSSSEGFSRDLTISATHAGPLTADDLRALVKAVVDSVPSHAKYLISIQVALSSQDAKFPDIATQVREAGLRQSAGDHSMGEMCGTRARFAHALDAGS